MDEVGWARLGRAIAKERGTRWRSRRDFARAVGVSPRLLDDLEGGRRDNYLDTTLAAVEFTLGWQPGTCMRVVQGGRVRRHVDADMERVWQAWPYLSRKSRRAIADLAERLR